MDLLYNKWDIDYAFNHDSFQKNVKSLEEVSELIGQLVGGSPNKSANLATKLDHIHKVLNYWQNLEDEA